MLVEVAFGRERIDLEVPDDRLVGAWSGPAGIASGEVKSVVAQALARPIDLPSLREAVVEGDQVVIALGAQVPCASTIISAIWDEISRAGVHVDDVVVLAEPDSGSWDALELPAGVRYHRHDPDDRTRIAYLASTAQGRRVYLDRDLTDADAVIAIGRLGFESPLGYSGPWSVIFPGLSDTPTRAAFQKTATEGKLAGADGPAMRESAEVGWLLGSLYQIGVLPGVTGLVDVQAGLATSVARLGPEAVNRCWRFEAESRAELVVMGLGSPDSISTLSELATALANAARLVQRGGKIAVLSRVAGDPGPSLQRLRGLDDIRGGPGALKGQESAPDYRDARRISEALAWADVYLLSDLDPDLVDDLSMIRLDRPEEVRRLVAVCGSTLVVNQAERVRAEVGHETDSGRP